MREIKILLLPLFLILFGLSLPGCHKNESQKSGGGHLSYVDVSPSRMNLSILGLLEALSFAEIQKNYSKIEVCIENGARSISDQQLLLETRLAYATWLSAAEVSSQAWSEFNFSVRASCEFDDKIYQSLVVIPNAATMNNRMHAIVATSAMQMPNYGTVTVLGIGGGGGASYSWNGSQFSFALSTQSRVVLNPYVDWLPLKNEFARNSDLLQQRDEMNNNSPDEQRHDFLVEKSVDQAEIFDDLMASYELLESLNSPSFAELMVMIDKLSQYQVRLAASASPARRISFDVLLHEVGHQFGMEHPHEFEVDDKEHDETPTTAAAIEDSMATAGAGSTQTIFSKPLASVMAYGNSFVYLPMYDLLEIRKAKKAAKIGLHELRFSFDAAKKSMSSPTSLLDNDRPIIPTASATPSASELVAPDPVQMSTTPLVPPEPIVIIDVATIPLCVALKAGDYEAAFACDVDSQVLCAKVDTAWDYNGSPQFYCRIN